MNRENAIAALVVLIGFASGPSALESARAAQPPIEWLHVPFSAVMSFVGILIVIGMQVALHQPKGAKLAWGFMMVGGIYCLASGFSAAAIAIVGTAFDPAALLFLAVGVGMTSGAVLSKVVFRASIAL